MAGPSRFLAICGSLRRVSTNLALLEAVRRHAPPGIDIEIFNGLAALPPFNPDDEGDRTPAAILDLAHKVGAADGLIIASPEYAHGIPGALKNSLDWLVSRFEIPDKPVMLVHASTRGIFARAHLSEVLRTMSVRLHDGPSFELHVMGKSPDEIAMMLDGDGNPERVRAMLAAFAQFARAPKL